MKTMNVFVPQMFCTIIMVHIPSFQVNVLRLTDSIMQAGTGISIDILHFMV